MSDGGSWKQWLLLGGLGAGGIVALYYVLTNFFVSPLNAYKNMADTQLAALIKKLDGYTKSNPNGLTASQQQSVDLETKILAQTTEGLANASKGIYDLGTELVIGATIAGFSLIAIKYLPDAIKKFRNKTPTAEIKTAEATTYIIKYGYALQMVDTGFPNEAANFMSEAQTTFQSVDLPYMQQYVSNIEMALPTLSGIELIVAQQMIESLTIEMAVIPTFLAMPLIPPI